MLMSAFFTIGELARQLAQPEWKVRRFVDRLGLTVPRAGLYRLVPAEKVPAIKALLAQAEPERTNAK
jgi:hypothetical protein